MGKLVITTQVPGPIDAVYKKVTVYEAGKNMEEEDVEKKYGKLIQKTDDVYLFREGEEGSLEWRITFDPPTRRFMEAVDERWADRVDTFKSTPTGTEWTITWHTRARGTLGILQLIVWNLSGGRRARRDIVAPVLAEFSSRR